eukprot:scaffold236326_cov23-Tisochrysis_lutea.AAC.1
MEAEGGLTTEEGDLTTDEALATEDTVTDQVPPHPCARRSTGTFHTVGSVPLLPPSRRQPDQAGPTEPRLRGSCAAAAPPGGEQARGLAE